MINILMLSKLFFYVDAEPISKIIYMLVTLFILNPK